MGREVEWKYRATPEILAAVRQQFPEWKTIIMETTYLDTPDGALQRRKWMLRRRLENGVAVYTLKTPLPDGSRGEWETRCDPSEVIEKLCKLGAPAELKVLTRPGLVETCAARFTRLAALVALPRCSVELALDEGSFLAGTREQPFCELEVEWKSGGEGDAAAFAQSLAGRFHLETEPKSKAQRAIELRGETKDTM